jgi:hypothetical protein
VPSAACALHAGVDLNSLAPGQRSNLPCFAIIAAEDGYKGGGPAAAPTLRSNSNLSSGSASSSSLSAGSAGSSSLSAGSVGSSRLSSNSDGSSDGGQSTSGGGTGAVSAAAAARRALASGVAAPLDGVVAVKIQVGVCER